MRTLLMPALMLTATLSLAGCSTGGTVTPPTVTPPVVNPPAAALPANPTAFFAANAAPLQNQTLTQDGTTQTLTFAGGTALTFAPSSVVDAGGNVFTGPVVVSVMEIRSKADMILNNVLTVSGTQPLVSGGMFFLDLKTQAGAALGVNPAKGLGAAVPIVGPPDAAMQQFVGGGNPNPMANPAIDGGPGGGPRIGAVNGGGAPNAGCSDPNPKIPTIPPVTAPALAAGDSSVNWCPVVGKYVIDTKTAPGSYVFSIFNKGWINCDKFFSIPGAKTSLYVGFDAINDDNTIVFLIPKGINSVIALYPQDGPNRRRSYFNSVPVGLETEVVALTFNNGKQYLAHKTITVSANLNVPLTFSEASTSDIKTYLASKN